jgi:hypothetical protein
MGEQGEVYTQIVFGLKRHWPRSPGFDGKLADGFIEVKTLSPERRMWVRVRRKANLYQLLI